MFVNRFTLRLDLLIVIEYTPQPQTWKAIDDILLSLRQKFGLHSFAHLDSLLVATGEPTNLLCLLEIFDTMYEHYRARGRSFSQPVVQDETLFTSSDGSGRMVNFFCIKSSPRNQLAELSLIIVINESLFDISSRTPGAQIHLKTK